MTHPDPKTFEYDCTEGVATVRLNRPERLNALTFDSYRELADTFRALQDIDEVRSVLLVGSGRAFCSGGDVEDIIGRLLTMDSPALLKFTRLTGELIGQMRLLRKPIVAGIHGTTCGAGAVMALASDYRVATARAKIAFLFTRVGLSGADMGAAWLLPRVVGLGHATAMLMRGHWVSPDEALAMGLYQELVDEAALADTARERALELARGPALGVQMTKEMLNRELSMSLEQALEAEAQAQALCMRHPDFHEANQAFRDKREPRFTDPAS